MGKVNKGKDDPVVIMVYEGEEGGSPHMHIRYDGNKISCVDLTKPRYSKHHDEMRPFTKQAKKEFIKIMKSDCRSPIEDAFGNIVRGTGYQYAVYLWIAAHENFSYDKFNLDDSGLPIMPDYSELITRK